MDEKIMRDHQAKLNRTQRPVIKQALVTVSETPVCIPFFVGAFHRLDFSLIHLFDHVPELCHVAPLDDMKGRMGLLLASQQH